MLDRVLLPFNLNPHSNALADAAYRIAESFGAEVEAVLPQLLPSSALPYSGEAPPPQMIEDMLDEARKANAAHRVEAKARADGWASQHPGVRSRLVMQEGAIADVVAARARLADLTIVAPECAEDRPFWDDVVDGAIFSSGRPALLHPFTPVSPRLGESVLIAWQDSVEVARAVAAAKPFIARAKRVDIVSVGGDEEADRRLDEVRAWLAHAQPAVTTRRVHGPGSVAERLIAETAAMEGGILVIGAYSHWRWRERVFGGVTEHLLQSATVPVLMAH